MSGTLLGVQDELQFLSQTNGDGTVTKCGVVGGTLRTPAGDVTFGAGGVLTAAGMLEPGVQAVVDTLHEAERQGSAAVTTITYAAGTICGYPGNVVTAASVKVTPAPTPFVPAGPGQEPQPTTRTVTGIVIRMSAFGQLIFGSTGTCQMWPGILKTRAGAELLFAVETPMTGSLDTELKPADPAAVKQAKLLQAAYLFGARAPVTMTYTGPVKACTYALEAVVETATIAFPSPYDTKPKVRRRGRITRLSGPSVVTGNGATCRIWRGTIKPAIGGRKRFSVETPLTGSPPRPADRRAVKIVATLRRAQRQRAAATITYAGPVVACGTSLGRVVTRASIR